jgi:ketosteroid isomerase-like protein
MDVSASDPSIAAIILQIEQQVFTAIQQKDTETLAGILSEDFVHRSPDGSEIDKGQFLKNITAVPVTVVSIAGEHQKVSVYGDVAVLTGVQRAAWKQSETEKGVTSGAFTEVFVRRGDRWLMVLAYSVDLPD